MLFKKLFNNLGVKSYILYFILSAIIIIIPNISFMNRNYLEIDNVFIKSIIINFFFYLFLITISAIFINFVFKKKIFNKLLIAIALFFFIFFYFFSSLKKNLVIVIYDISDYDLSSISGEISFIILLFIYLIFIILVLFKNNSFAKRFISIFIAICFFTEAYFLIYNLYKLKSSKQNFVTAIDKKKISSINSKRNIYLIIVDDAVDLNEFEKVYKRNYSDKFLNTASKYGFKYISGTKTAYPYSSNSIASAFFMKYHLNEKNINDYPEDLIYPKILAEPFIYKLPLIKYLDDIDYDFFWFGNATKNCELYNQKLCHSNYLKNEKNILFSYNVILTFYKSSPFYSIENRIRNLFKSYKSVEDNFKKRSFENNDSFKKFYKTNIKQDSKKFIFMHLMIPHEPFVYDSDCKFKKINTTYSPNDEHYGYKKNYECMLKKLEEFFSYIYNNDNNANIVITSDHGEYINKNNYKTSKYDTFTIVKFDKSCLINAENTMNLPNAARSLLSCSTDYNFKLLAKKSFFIDKGNKKKKITQLYNKNDEIINWEKELRLRNIID